MYPLIRKNLRISGPLSYITVLILIALAYITTFPPIFTIIIITLSMLTTLYYYDDKNKINQFLISLPVAKENIVMSKYITMAILSIALLLYQWLIMLLFSANGHMVYGWYDVITVFSMTLLMFALFIPLYYIFRSPHLATGVILILFFVIGIITLDPLVTVLGMEDYIFFNDLDAGFSLLVEKYIPFLPYLTLLIISVIIFYVSMRISEGIFTTKDQDH